MSKTKADLLEEIEILKHNMKCKESTIEIQIRRLEKVCDFLITKDYSKENIREILKLPEER